MSVEQAITLTEKAIKQFRIIFEKETTDPDAVLKINS